MDVKTAYAEIKSTFNVSHTIVAYHNGFAFFEVVAIKQNFVHIAVGFLAGNVRADDDVGKVFADTQHINFGRGKVVLCV